MRKIFFANWKTYLTDDEAEALARTYAERSGASSVDIAIAPSFTALERVARVLDNTSVALGAQDAFWSDAGAETGEVTPKQLAALGARFVIVGHSERRALGDTDEIVARKVRAVTADGLTPVVCVGELGPEREAGRQAEVVRGQLQAVLEVHPNDAPLIVAYEPRWAIGSGTPCRPEDVDSMHTFMREIAGPSVRILYGGSVDPNDIASYLDLAGVDGVLVGGASARPADVEEFFKLFSR